MFGIGFSELILIFVVALLVLGPKRLPEVARTLGKFYREIKSTVDEVKEVVIEEPTKHTPRKMYEPPSQEEKITTLEDINSEVDKEKEGKDKPERKKISFKKKKEGDSIDESGV